MSTKTRFNQLALPVFLGLLVVIASIAITVFIINSDSQIDQNNREYLRKAQSPSVYMKIDCTNPTYHGEWAMFDTELNMQLTTTGNCVISLVGSSIAEHLPEDEHNEQSK